MFTQPDRNGTSHQQRKHDRSMGGAIFLVIAIWFFGAIGFVSMVGDEYGTPIYLVGTFVIVVWRYLKRTKLPKSSC